ncbi:tetratricopeptide repeat protein [Tenacibaculum piscium]|uniref:Tetratricopeptide TPR_2 repeat-containing protein n=1 Tax=Tenacibaculum piscium TaxID=1458515 RepID=A0A2H1YKG8_9FLAO|nr:tetratricopeptide repeat protein [Tenacibaculum piscium]MBE7628499.1 tetratricopeptide repeat protein [Tenacibaculum piscium]MBE7669639.1 tetratricopeptide repeat protein [Tenacibaculum piscium]SOS75287.1 Tetratricopeptide TPR_2 repeat-containing protein [Tenacibaculum piscium]
MKKIYVAFFAVFIVLISISCSTELTSEQKKELCNTHMIQAKNSLHQGDYQNVITHVNTIIEINETIPRAFLLKGIASTNLKMLDQAAENFEKVIELEGESSKAYKNLAYVYYLKNDADFEDAIKKYLIYHKDEEAHALKRVYFEQKEDFDNAINEYSLAINKEQNNTELYLKRADLYHKNGDLENALTDFETVLKISPNNKSAKKNKKELLVKLNKSHDTMVLFWSLLGFYIIYVLVSFFVLKPIVVEKAKKLGGEISYKKDALIWILPILLFIIFITRT